ncbi:hypothetical protein YPPY61_2551, partial [Yersinia pestis PY-61]
MNWGSGQ